MKGRIKTYDQTKGFGFIIGEDDNDYYFHISYIKSYELPEQGVYTEFTASRNDKGDCAIDIYIIKNKQITSIIILDDVRLKKCNIKNYGITKKKFPYEKIYVVEQINGKFNRFMYGDTRLIITRDNIIRCNHYF